MKKVIVIIQFIFFATFFQNCKSTKQEVGNIKDENIVIQTVELSKEVVDTVIATKSGFAIENKDSIRAIVETKIDVVDTIVVPIVKEVVVIKEHIAPIKQDVSVPKKDEVVVKEPTPTPMPKVESKEQPKGVSLKPVGKEWKVPANDAKVKNKIKSDAGALAAGKEIWNKDCKSCHGTKGLGDGVKAEKIDISCGDFSSSAFQIQTDGEIYYKTSKGRKPMPSFEEKLDDTQRWQLVVYMRTMKK